MAEKVFWAIVALIAVALLVWTGYEVHSKSTTSCELCGSSLITGTSVNLDGSWYHESCIVYEWTKEHEN